ncbi:MAG: DUF1328 domain-containing protein [Planctomycetes bacterium]|nr:DUF1328 domain-containing protein [Planctomycetota bacterium]
MPSLLGILLLCALSAGLLGFIALSGTAAGVARILYLVFIAGSLVLLASGRRQPAG